MSGISAVLDRTGDGLDPGRVREMLAAIDHRGPDGRDHWTAGAVGLGHQHNWTTPQGAVDDQPREADGCVVTADARLDNRRELLARLDVATDGPVPDSTLLLAAYRRWGTACAEYLRGAFAFAIRDTREERIFCARDRFGVKPLYYHECADAFACASEVKALLALPWIEPHVDETKIGDFLIQLFEDQGNTFYEGVRRLPPAHAMTVDPGGMEQYRYWDLDPTRTVTLDSDDAYARRFRELFERAVARRLRTDARIATTLSGGLDSASITAVARDQLDPAESLRTYSGVFDESPASDEREYIEALVERDGIDPEYVFLDDRNVLSGMGRTLAYFDEPVHNTMHYMKWEIARRAGEDGVGVVLEGAHGDNAVGYGLGRLPELARTGQWATLVRELRSLGKVLDRPARGLFVGLVLGSLVPRWLRRFADRVRGQPTAERGENPAIARDFVDRIGLRDRYHELDDEGSVLRRSARRWQYRSLTTGSMTAFLEANDVIHAAHGLEPRYPFIDSRLVEFTLAIPPSQQLRDGWTRMIIRRALDDLLPRATQWRPWKTQMNAAFMDALAAADDEIRALLDEPAPIRPYLDPDRLRDAYEEFQADRGMRNARTLWTALSLAAWLDSAGTTDERPSTSFRDRFDTERQRR